MTIALNPNQQTILEHAAQNSGGKIAWFPEHIKGGARAKVLEGETEMAVNHALEDYEVRAGYVLSCQCYPLSDRVVVSYDA